MMGIISLTITESATQTTPGIPDTVSITANEPCIIFYTLDGTDPNTYSSVYTSAILMPQNLLNLTLKIFATNQIDNSAIITNQYVVDAANLPTAAGARLPHSAVSPLNNASTNNSLFPFGSNSPNPTFEYLNPADAGTTVYNPALPATPNGFDGSGNPSGFTNKPQDYFKFKQVYSTSNVEGEVFPGVGNLPAKTTIIGKSYPIEYNQERSDFADKIFNPRALVIYQDTTTEDPTNPSHLNRPNFSLENTEIVRDGNLLFNSSLDSPTTTGSFVNRYYNPRTNMMTCYHYDNAVGRWIISTAPYQSTNKDNGALYQMVFPRATENHGSNRVYKWIPGMRRILF